MEDLYELNGVKLGVPKDIGSDHLRRKLESGGYESDEARAATRRVRPGQRVLEIGAGLGYVTTICAKKAGPENVLSVEANPKMLPVIRANLDRNGCSKVELMHAAVTGPIKDGETAPFYAGSSFWGGSLLPRDGWDLKGQEVPLLSISALLQAHRPHVVMMDIEGAEARMFSRKWPRFVQFLVMEIHPDRYENDTVVQKIVDCMSASGLTYDHRTSAGRVLGFRRVRKREKSAQG